MSTTVPAGILRSGLSTILWKIQGWLERRSILSLTCGNSTMGPHVPPPTDARARLAFYGPGRHNERAPHAGAPAFGESYVPPPAAAPRAPVRARLPGARAGRPRQEVEEAPRARVG